MTDQEIADKVFDRMIPPFSFYLANDIPIGTIIEDVGFSGKGKVISCEKTERYTMYEVKAIKI